MNNTENELSVATVDLFCGIGGLSYGLKKAGLNVVAGIDVDDTCKYAYEANNAPFVNKSISKVTTKELSDLYEGHKIKVLVGCAPCQTFSKHTQKVKGREESSKWRLLDDFAKKIKSVKPDLVSMENVPQLAHYDVFESFVSVLEDQGYYITYRNIFCPDYGIPQNRSRLVLLASLLGPISIIPKTHTKDKYKTVRQTIGKLSKVKAGSVSKNDRLHRVSMLSKINLKRIKQSKQGGTWKDWDEDLMLDCHKKKSGETYSAVYGRMKWDETAPTITTQFYSYGTGRFGHPVQNRALSLREGALLQTFPKKYKFIAKDEEVAIRKIGRHIGNAVPVRLGEIIGRSIMKHIKEHYEEEI